MHLTTQLFRILKKNVYDSFGSFQIIFYISKLINIYFLRKNKKILFDLKKQKLLLK
jgi:hypothetical protein